MKLFGFEIKRYKKVIPEIIEFKLDSVINDMDMFKCDEMLQYMTSEQYIKTTKLIMDNIDYEILLMCTAKDTPHTDSDIRDLKLYAELKREIGRLYDRVVDDLETRMRELDPNLKDKDEE